MLLFANGVRRRADQKAKVDDLKEEVTDDNGGVDLTRLENKCNNLAFGWLEIEACDINTPVMYKPGDSEFYLSHNMYGEESVSGIPFVAGEGGSGRNHLIIYGHHMADGSVFNHLDYFKIQEFFNRSPRLKLTSLSPESGEYIPIAVILTDTKSDFDYYNWTDLNSLERYERYMSLVRENALYFREDKNSNCLISLSTCSYHCRDGRLVVVFKKVN